MGDKNTRPKHSRIVQLAHAVCLCECTGSREPMKIAVRMLRYRHSFCHPNAFCDAPIHTVNEVHLPVVQIEILHVH